MAQISSSSGTHSGTPTITQRILMTTLPDEGQAREVAKLLVTRKLAACINILPKMTSIYEWEDKLEQGEEHLLLIKTEQHLVTELQNTIKEIHPYELPEIIAVNIDAGYEKYLGWIRESTNRKIN